MTRARLRYYWMHPRWMQQNVLEYYEQLIE